ncbi:MAG: SDR family NAD(P)-dependent oxidoreductase [Chloroflexi bacterium]|nr:SDR family NAD(P)-dependent oxidoreductase [Chloroflexota bacterium]
MPNEVMIITGASSGIGAATARRVARDHVRLTLAARREDRLQEVAREVERLGSEALIVRTDVTDRTEIRRMVHSLRRRLRGSGIHGSAFCPCYTPSEITPRLKAHVEGRADAPHHPGLMPTDYVADQMARLVRHPRRLVVLPRSWSVLVLVGFLFPGVADVLVSRFKAKRPNAT